jgi:hypothetical protein
VFQDPSLDDELTAYENMNFHGVLYKVPGKILGGATVAMMQGMFRATNYAMLPLAFVFMLVAVTALGTVSDFQGLQFVTNFSGDADFFLSGALFPLTNIPGPWQWWRASIRLPMAWTDCGSRWWA